MSGHTAMLMRVEDHNGARCVVYKADDVIWIAPELLAEAAPHGQAQVSGGLERDRDTITFGTPGEGMGRLTYRLVGEHYEYGRYKVHVAERIWP